MVLSGRVRVGYFTAETELNFYLTATQIGRKAMQPLT